MENKVKNYLLKDYKIINPKELTKDNITKLIEEKEIESLNFNEYNYIGIDCPTNFKEELLLDENYIILPEDSENTYFYGYLRKDTKINYGVVTRYYNDNMSMNVASLGMNYYMDNNDYIYNFFEYIKDKDYENEYDLILLVKEFLDNYFYTLTSKNNSNREDVLVPIYIDDEHVLESRRSNKVFEKENIGVCTEYATFANNILTLLGFNSIVIVGEIDCFDYTNNEKEVGSHAWNLITIDNEPHLVDFSANTQLINFDDNKTKEEPYICSLYEEELDALLENKSLSMQDYYDLKINNEIVPVFYDKNRVYSSVLLKEIKERYNFLENSKEKVKQLILKGNENE